MKLFLASPHTITRFPEGGDLLMRLFMAGGISGNLKPFWSDVAGKIKEGESIEQAKAESIKGFLNDPAATFGDYKPYVLESFFYCDDTTERLLPYFGDFLLDSGAFTFCGTGGFTIDQFDLYLEKYADFINRNKVDKFFELDVDSITGYEKVIEYRRKLERLTGKQPIPVWHPGRGKEEFLRHCDEYPYVALGGYVAAIKISDPKQKAYVRSYPWFISEAHKRGKKIHGLGFTSLDGLTKNHFDSVDSTAWTTGNRFGYIYFFDGKTMKKINAPKGYRLKDSRMVAFKNFTEWVKFQQFADKYL